MTPSEAICDIVTTVFPGSTCRSWHVATTAVQHFSFRMVVGGQVFGIGHAIPDELMNTEAAAREIVQKTRDALEREIGKTASGRQSTFTSPWTGLPMGSRPAGERGGWYETGTIRRDNTRLLESARIATERQEEEQAKASIMDALAQREIRKQRASSRLGKPSS